MKPNWTAEIALHEAAHCVAMYLEGMEIDKVRVSKSDGSVVPASKSSEDPFAHAVALLAGNAFMRSLGRPDDGDSNDFVRASFLIAEQFLDHPGAAKEAFAIVGEATEALVRTPRFIDLTTALAPKLAKGYLHLGSEIERFLIQPDPECLSTGRLSQFEPVVAPWYKVCSDNSKMARLLYEGDDEAEASRIARLNPNSLKLGSIYA